MFSDGWGFDAVVILAPLATGLYWWLNIEQDRRERFARLHAPGYSRGMDCIYWVIRHGVGLWRSGGDGKRQRAEAGRVIACLLCGAFVLALPILAVLVPDAGKLKGHGVAFGVGVLIWTLVVELVAQPERNARYNEATTDDERKKLPRRVVRRVAGLFVVEALLYGFIVFSTGLSGTWWATAFGAAVTATADAMAVCVTFAVGPHDHTPFEPLP